MNINKETYNPFLTAQSQFDKAAELLMLSQATRDLLRNPMREFHFSIPIKMDDGKSKVFRGYRIQHNDARGPAKGGVRFHPLETIDSIRAMSMWMTWKSAVVNLPLGGGKGGVICDPHYLSMHEQEQICRGWVRSIAKVIGPKMDVPAPDIMTNSQHMLWMLDEYEAIYGERIPGVITGKPIEMGGSQGRLEATGYGVIIMLREAMKEIGLKSSNVVASIQGFGNVSRYTIELFNKMGGKVICVSSWDNKDMKAYAYRKKEGIILNELVSITDKFGGINKEKAQDLGYEVLPGDDWISQDVDILIPAAVSNQININNVDLISKRVKIIAEAADGPTSLEADKILSEKNLMILPDFLSNAGGVVVSYFELVQNNMNYYWSKDEVLAKLDEKMSNAYADVSLFSLRNQLDMRYSSYVIAVEKVAKACEGRGWV